MISNLSQPPTPLSAMPSRLSGISALRCLGSMRPRRHLRFREIPSPPRSPITLPWTRHMSLMPSLLVRSRNSPASISFPGPGARTLAPDNPSPPPDMTPQPPGSDLLLPALATTPDTRSRPFFCSRSPSRFRRKHLTIPTPSRDPAAPLGSDLPPRSLSDSGLLLPAQVTAPDIRSCPDFLREGEGGVFG